MTPMPTDQTPRYAISVGALCEFSAKRGDLDRRFSPSPTAQEGIAGHRQVGARRGGSNQAEVSLSIAHRDLLVRGRADHYHRQAGLVEEVKTFRGDLARMPENRRALHWTQANTYAWMLCAQEKVESISVALVYYDVDQDLEIPALLRARSAQELRTEFEALCDAFMDWAAAERSHRARRDAWLAQLQFPHSTFRPGQRDLATAVWRAVRQERTLVAEAPTGIGKTVATLFPAMKAMAGEQVDRVFFLTARTTGRRIALDAAQSIREANDGAAFRVLELTAREKACEYPENNCSGDSCPLARGFYDRLPAARQEARDVGLLDRSALRTIALAHDICPYYLGLEMARWCDLVVGDFNHWFDGHALLAALTEEYDWRVVVLVDEAHNLPDRARAMYSQRIGSELLDDAKACATDTLKKPLARLTRAWNRLGADVAGAYMVCEGLPRALLDALKAVTDCIDRELAVDPDNLPAAVRELYFGALELERLAASFGSHSIFDVTVDGFAARRKTTVGIRNLVPAPFLAPRHAAARATVLFSATLTPHAFYADMLGLQTNAVRIDIPPPFSATQLTVRIVRHISTRLADRERSIDPLGALVADEFKRMPGNYLVFLSSHAYLQQLADAFTARYPDIPCWSQARRMSEPDRDAFLHRFQIGGRGIGFAVLGGVFGEGVDLPGDRLVGAFIATLGLPQFDEINEEQRRRLDASHGSGFEYTYLYPGLRRVVQAAGRVIRTTNDRGRLFLIDDRFAKEDVIGLLPAWWELPERGGPSARSGEIRQVEMAG